MVVFMDQADYVTEALRQLQDPEYYTALAEPIYLETAKQIEGELRALQASNYHQKTTELSHGKIRTSCADISIYFQKSIKPNTNGPFHTASHQAVPSFLIAALKATV